MPENIINQPAVQQAGGCGRNVREMNQLAG